MTVASELIGAGCLIVPRARVMDAPGDDVGEQTVPVVARLGDAMEMHGPP